ncbi:MarR family transcriptional regulator [Clostridium chromiireducens]|uniref:MarR family transcriptional regulator n=1 Tax=Clostridium chromiireducens TaxID=225345 RepID=A0A399IPI7_9CLOT|nr:MarR family winged helix-turn-helix transcriptional regulator [Clostridium chromiireducens]RII34209.1 MarR family transcriptional regulator [Clostridium chromiireducens]
MNVENMNFMMLISKIFRYKQIYLDKVLKKYEISSGSRPYLFNLEKNEGISQIGLSKELDNDRAMTARTIAKLIKLGYVYSEQDEKGGRSNKLYLTAKAKEVLPEMNADVEKMMRQITEGLSEGEILITMQSLRKILLNIRKLDGFDD